MKSLLAIAVSSFSLLIALDSVSAQEQHPAQAKRYIVRFKEGAEAAATTTKTQETAGVEVKLRTSAARHLPATTQPLSFIHPDNSIVTLLTDVEARALAAHVEVDSVEIDQPMRAFRTTNDPYLPQQKCLRAYPGIDVFPAWDKTSGTTNTVVAVLDSGTDYSHPDLRGAMWSNSDEVPNNGRDDDENGLVDDYYGYDFVNNTGAPFDDAQHGTHVSGIVAARANNAQGIAGVAFGSKLVALKVLDSGGGGYASDIIRAMDYLGSLRARGVPIVAANLSLGGGYSRSFERAARRMLSNGILIVTAAGNESSNNDTTPVYPANFKMPHVVTVSAIDKAGNLAPYSNFGARSVTLSAPGTDILSTVPYFITGRYFDRLSGTSMATPHVAGTAALVAAMNPKLTAPLIRSVLIDTARNSPALNGTSTTSGVLDAAAAVALAETQPYRFTLSGVVKNNGVGEANAWIVARAQGKRTRKTRTTSSGTYALRRLEAASYRVTPQKTGLRFKQPSTILVVYRDTTKDFPIR